MAHGSSGHRSLSEVLTVFAPRDTRTAASARHRTPVTESEVKRSYHPLPIGTTIDIVPKPIATSSSTDGKTSFSQVTVR